MWNMKYIDSSSLDIPYTRLLQVPDDEREYLNLEELKPHQITELGILNNATNQQSTSIDHGNRLSQNLPNDMIVASSNGTVSSTTLTNSDNCVYRVQPSYHHQHQHHHPQFAQQASSSTMPPHHHHNHPETNQIYYDLNLQNNTNGTNSLFGACNGDDMTQTVIATASSSSSSNVEGRLGTPIPDHSLSRQSPTFSSASRKRKAFHTNTDASDYDDDNTGDDKSVRTTDENKKQNHSEIEKRRRDRMNTYITELSAMVPMCHAMSRKLDKLTVLRMAVQHLKTIRGAVHSYTEGHYKPTFLSDQEFKMLILQAADGFLFVVGCDRGRILYVSDSVSQSLNYSQADLLGQSWFDILHPKDVAKVKEQLSSSDLSPREKLIDAKTMLPVKADLPHGMARLCPGARRSFFCRMKYKVTQQMKDGDNADTLSGCHRRKKQMSSDKKYCVIQCTGYLKSWAPAKIGLEEQETDSEGDSCSLSCLVAVGRIIPNVLQTNVSPPLTTSPNSKSIQFISRHAMDGKFLFVDQRATLVLGFLPQELLGTSMYEYYQQDDIPALAEAHKTALQATHKVTTSIYRFRTKDNGIVRLQTEWKSFKNPWTKDVEYIIAKNSVILNDTLPQNNDFVQTRIPEDSSSTTSQIPSNLDFFNPTNGRDMNRMINTHIEASKIGRQIAVHVLDSNRRGGESSSESSPDPENRVQSTTNQVPSSSGENSSTAGNEDGNVDTNRPPLPVPPRLNGTCNHAAETEVIGLIESAAIPESPSRAITAEGNDEAAMAVIMSLLEADAGLGGPVDFTGLPWPLP